MIEANISVDENLVILAELITKCWAVEAGQISLESLQMWELLSDPPVGDSHQISPRLYSVT